MKVLLAFATNSGGTYIASGIVETELKKANHEVTVKKIDAVDVNEFTQYDLILLAAPTWFVNKQDGMPQDQMNTFIELNKEKSFPGKKFAVFGLGDSSYTKFCGVVDHLEAFVKNIKGELITASLRVDGFYFNPKNSELVAEWARKLVKV